MKKLFALFTVAAMLTMSVSNVLAQDAKKDNKAVAKTEVKQDAKADTAKTAAVDSTKATAEKPVAKDTTAAAAQERSFHQVLKDKFIEGGAGWMAPIAFCLIVGLALCIERILYLSLSSTNTKKLLNSIDEAWAKGGVEAAMEVCRNTRGPVASIFYQGLSRYDEGIDVVEKSVASYGGVQLGLLEKNLTWVSLFITLSPSLGFLGTVVGMIQAFDKIQQVGDISATVVAGGMKVALLTTVFGLIVAMILQVFFNYILTLIESMTTDMEDSSISLLDIIVKHQKN